MGRIWGAALLLLTSNNAVADVEAEIDTILAEMSLEQKVGQMFLAGVPADGDTPLHLGGVIFLGGQLRDIDAVSPRIDSLQARSVVPLLIAADVEGGQVNRLKRHPELTEMPSATALGAGSFEEAYAWGVRAGSTMRSIGLNCNLAPVLDVAGTGHLAASERVYADSPERVSEIGSAFVEGLNSTGVAAIGKHFPGYGEVTGDSDHTLVVTERAESDFQAQIGAFVGVGDGLSGVMMTNVGFTNYGGVPAPFSSELVAMAHSHGWLTITDDLAIPALQEVISGGPEEVVVRAFLAGNDLLLTTWPLDAATAPNYVETLVTLVSDDPTLQARVDDSVRRILEVKARMGLISP
jgi:beta-N-acetylhexosaminidase